VQEARCKWLDRQTSSLVRGQTPTRDATIGGLETDKKHEEVLYLRVILNRVHIIPWMQFEFEPQRTYYLNALEKPCC